MRTFIIAALIVMLAVPASAQIESATLKASGLTCAMCSRAVKDALEKVEFVSEVKVDIRNQEYKLKFKKDAELVFDKLKDAVEDAGFSVAVLSITGNFGSAVLQKDQHLELGGQAFHFLISESRKVDGLQTVRLVDKGFLSAREHKDYEKLSEMTCVKTGETADCCTDKGLKSGSRVYHVII